MENSRRQDLSKPANIAATRSFTKSPRPSFSMSEPLDSTTNPSAFQQTVLDSLFSDEPQIKKLLDSPFFISEKLAAHKLVLNDTNRNSDEKLSARDSRSESVTLPQVNLKTVSENNGKDIQLEEHDDGESKSLSDSIPDHHLPSEKDEQMDYLKTISRSPSPTQVESVTDLSMSTDRIDKEIDKRIPHEKGPSASLDKLDSRKTADVGGASDSSDIIVGEILSSETHPSPKTSIKSEKVEKDEEKEKDIDSPSSNETHPSLKAIIKSEKVEEDAKEEKENETEKVIEKEKEKEKDIVSPSSIETHPSPKAIIKSEKVEEDEDKEKEKETEDEDIVTSFTNFPEKIPIQRKVYQRSNSDHLYFNQKENDRNEEKIAEIPKEFNMDDAPYMRGITGGQFDFHEGEETSFPKTNSAEKVGKGRGLNNFFPVPKDSGMRTTDENTRTPPTASNQSSTMNSPRSANTSASGLVVDVDICDYEKKTRVEERR